MKRLFLSVAVLLCLWIVPVGAIGPKLIVGGESVGIVIRYSGVYVTGTYAVKTEDGLYDPMEHSDIQIGDLIIEADGREVDSMDTLFAIMQDRVKTSSEMTVSILRDHSIIQRSMKMYYSQESKTFKTGLYVKDSISGVGTVSFYNPSNRTYGALGHDIINNQTGKSAEVGSGSLFLTRVVTIRKSAKGTPGEKIADTSSFTLIGNVMKNNIYGVYGTYQKLPETASLMLEMASQQEVKLGPAKIRTVVKDDEIEEFDIEITKLDHQLTKDIKGIQFRITDARLLQMTGGIVQGMSGSPIIQNGKIIGAITHVLVQKPDQGYGIYIEWMVDEANAVLAQ